MRKRYPTWNCSRLPGVDFGFPDFKSQQVPVQPDAMGLQAVNGERTTISISVVTSASVAGLLAVDLKDPVHREEIPAGLAEWIWATHRSTASAFGTGDIRCLPNSFFGSPLAAVTSAIFPVEIIGQAALRG